MGTGASVLFSTRPVVVQGPKDRLTSTGSGLSLLPSLQLGLHPKDRLNSFFRTFQSPFSQLPHWPYTRCHVYFSSLFLSKQDGMWGAGPVTSPHVTRSWCVEASVQIAVLAQVTSSGLPWSGVTVGKEEGGRRGNPYRFLSVTIQLAVSDSASDRFSLAFERKETPEILASAATWAVLRIWA